MGRYNFTSPGANAANAIEEFLLRRAMEARAEQELEMQRQSEAAQIGQRDADLDLRRQQEARIERERQDAAASLETERQFRRASTVADNLMPGVLDPGTADLLKTQGYGGLVKEGQPTQGAAQFDETTINEVPQYDVIPGVLETQGGFKWQQARQQEQARAESAAASAQAAAERANADREARSAQAAQADETRRLIATMNAQNAGATRSLQNELTQTKIDAANDKRTEAQRTEQRNLDARARSAQDVMDLIGQLTEVGPDRKRKLNSNAQGLFGARIPFLRNIPGTGTADADAALKRLQGRAVVDLLSEMKAQSRTGATGLGALSAPELRLLENTAAMLGGSLSDDAAAEELDRLYGLAERAGSNAAAPSGGGTVAMVAPDGRQLSVPAEKVAEMEALGAKRR